MFLNLCFNKLTDLKTIEVQILQSQKTSKAKKIIELLVC